MPNPSPSPTPGSPRREAARPYIGGQAVLEGVMMRAPRSFAVVVRRKDRSLFVRERGMTDTRKGFAKLPLVRGVASLVESLKLGSEALRFSVEQMEKDLDMPDPPPVAQSRSSKAASVVTKILTALGLSVFALTTADGDVSGSGGKARKGAMGLMLLIVIVFFIAAPQAAAEGINDLFHLGLDVQSPGFQAITGAMKLTIVVSYLLLIRRVKDIRRVFQYHGAEHKTISTYEANEELTVENARKKTTLHPRCGTTFLVMVALVSIVVFTMIGGLLPKIEVGNRLITNVIFFAEKLPFLPALAAVTFELQRFFARFCTVGPLRVLLWPGFLVQKITTVEPDDDQLEVALASLRATLFRQELGENPKYDDDVRFPSYEAILAAERLRPEAREAA